MAKKMIRGIADENGFQCKQQETELVEEKVSGFQCNKVSIKNVKLEKQLKAARQVELEHV